MFETSNNYRNQGRSSRSVKTKTIFRSDGTKVIRTETTIQRPDGTVETNIEEEIDRPPNYIENSNSTSTSIPIHRTSNTISFTNQNFQNSNQGKKRFF